MRFFAVALAFFGAAASFAQTPEVPHKMRFAGMALTIRDDALKEIQADVDALTQHSRYFEMKVERAKTYFPVIERIFAEEGVPDDFKYLVLQESALVADAVSVSNAVGFWQFKDFTAMEMGLRVDKQIDERMNLVSATRGAARYLKQNNFRFNNWLLTLQSYQMGAGGVQRALGNSQNGSRQMEITSETYWYVKKFLAHKVTFENSISGEPQLKVIAFEPQKGKTIEDIAKDLAAEESDLKEYNKWLKTSAIPDDRTYTMLIPVGKHDEDFTKLILSSAKVAKTKLLVDGNIAAERIPGPINSIPVIVARQGETVVALAQRGKLDLADFLKYNDVSIDHVVNPGESFLLDRKKNRGDQEFYRTGPGDNLWSISQQFGVKLKSLRKYNEIDESQKLEMNSVIWLQGRKSKILPAMPDGEGIAILDDVTFDWYTKTPKSVVRVPSHQIMPDSDSLSTTPSNPRDLPPEISSRSSEYIVKPGDTFYSIAKQYGVEVSSLLAWNELTVQNGLKPNQIIKVAENEMVKNEAGSDHGELTVHQVSSTDTLYSIARQYGVTIKDIIDWNHKKDFSLSMGEKLEIRRK